MPGYRFHRDGKGTQETENAAQRCGKLVARWPHQSFHMFSARPQRARQLPFECYHFDESPPVGDENPVSNLQTKNERRRKWGRIQEEDVKNNASQIKEHGPADDGREERGKHLENTGLGHLRRA